MNARKTVDYDMSLDKDTEPVNDNGTLYGIN